MKQLKNNLLPKTFLIKQTFFNHSFLKTSFQTKNIFLNSSILTNINKTNTITNTYTQKPLIKTPQFFFAGCGGGSSGNSNPNDLDLMATYKISKNKNKKQELKLKAMNYEIIEHIEQGKYPEALELIADYLTEIKNFYSENHKYYLSGLNNKAFLLKLTGEKEEAKNIYKEVLGKYNDINKEYFEGKSVEKIEEESVIIVKQNLATILRDLGNNEEAIKIFEGLFTQIKQGNGSNNSIVKPHVAVNIFISASGSYRAIKQYSVVEQLLDRAENIIEENYGDDNLPSSHLLNQKGFLAKEQGKYDEALSHYNKSLKIKESILEKNHPEILITLNNIAQVYYKQGEVEKANEILNRIPNKAEEEKEKEKEK